MVRTAAAMLLSLAACGACKRSNGPEQSTNDEEVRSVYPDTAPANALVQSLCDALNHLPPARRAECCHRAPGIDLASECIRTLGAAVASKAVRLDADEVNRCVQAQRSALEGCDWVGPNSDPPPVECRGIIHGTQGARAPCRSSLECGPGLHCEGVGPTQAGTCAEPSVASAPCGRAVDALVAYARQDAADREHPSCSGFCQRRACVAAATLGRECSLPDQCGSDAHCAAGSCAAGAVAQLGEACVPGGCVDGARCVEGKCAHPLPAGSPCHADVECLAGCRKADGGTAGTCSMDCG
jgi:hypothetical protein